MEDTVKKEEEEKKRKLLGKTRWNKYEEKDEEDQSAWRVLTKDALEYVTCRSLAKVHLCSAPHTAALFALRVTAAAAALRRRRLTAERLSAAIEALARTASTLTAMQGSPRPRPRSAATVSPKKEGAVRGAAREGKVFAARPREALDAHTGPPPFTPWSPPWCRTPAKERGRVEGRHIKSSRPALAARVLSACLACTACHCLRAADRVRVHAVSTFIACRSLACLSCVAAAERRAREAE